MYDLPGGAEAFDDVRITLVGGGSRDWGQKLMNDLALADGMAGEVRLYDVDYESAKTNARLGQHVQSLDEAVGEWTYEAVPELGEALEGADFVLLSTQDPPEHTFVHDLECPEAYGIVQTVGDTVGPGGTMRAMRTIPQYREIATAVRDHCPDAWVFNYTNPMTVCTRALSEAFPGINVLGVCHEVYHVQSHLASLVETHLDEPAEKADIDVDVTGINHFTWLTGIRWQGRDLFDLVEAEMDAYDIPGEFDPGELDDMSVYGGHNLVTYDLYRRFGAYPAAGDRHLAEFVPWYLDVDDIEDLHRWGIKVTPAEHRATHWDRGENERQAYLAGESPFELTPSGEEMVQTMRALLGGNSIRTNLNLPNEGQVPWLPEGVVVETNALVTGNEVTPLSGGRVPEQVESMVETHVHNQETLVEAGFAGDVDLAYQAFLNDPLVTIDPESARSLFRDLVEAEQEYLMDWELAEADVLG